MMLICFVFAKSLVESLACLVTSSQALVFPFLATLGTRQKGKNNENELKNRRNEENLKEVGEYRPSTA